MISTILLVFSLVLAILAAANVGHPRVNLGWAAFAFYVASLLFGGYHLR